MKKPTHNTSTKKSEEAGLRQAAHDRVWGGTGQEFEKVEPATPLEDTTNDSGDGETPD